jgi:hypothetical protein
LKGKKILVQGIGHFAETLVDYSTREYAIIKISALNQMFLREVITN